MSRQNSNFPAQLLRWYDRSRRELPWRVAKGQRPDPYHVLVSETMLQQTQIKTVIPYFHRFIGSWPRIADLAAADEQDILRAWQGLGYYSRARNLLATAKIIVAEFKGDIPHDVPTLLKLPGIGRYTAGAIASLAYDTPAPILDGNVARVLCRLDLIQTDPRDRETQARLWRRAEEILPKKRCGDFNSALMELGATVCTPRSPQCLICSVREYCKAFTKGMQERIPVPRKIKEIPQVHRCTFCIHQGEGVDATWLIEQRPSKGRWASLWQFVTAEADGSKVTPKTIHAIAGVKPDTSRKIGTIEHALTHRRYRFEVYLCGINRPQRDGEHGPHRCWVRLDELGRYPLPRPHLRIAEMLRSAAHDRANS